MPRPKGGSNAEPMRNVFRGLLGGQVGCVCAGAAADGQPDTDSRSLSSRSISDHFTGGLWKPISRLRF